MTGRAFLLFILCTIAGAAYALPPCEQVGYSLSNPPAWPNYRVGWHSVTAYDPSFGPVCVYPRGAGIAIWRPRVVLRWSRVPDLCVGLRLEFLRPTHAAPRRDPCQLALVYRPVMGPTPYIPPVW